MSIDEFSHLVRMYGEHKLSAEEEASMERNFFIKEVVDLCKRNYSAWSVKRSDTTIITVFEIFFINNSGIMYSMSGNDGIMPDKYADTLANKMTEAHQKGNLHIILDAMVYFLKNYCGMRTERQAYDFQMALDDMAERIIHDATGSKPYSSTVNYIRLWEEYSWER